MNSNYAGLSIYKTAYVNLGVSVEKWHERNKTVVRNGAE